MRVIQAFLLILIATSHAYPQESPPEVNLSVYCRNNVVAPFRIGVDDNLDIEFRVTFDGASPSKNMQLYFIDGNVENGKVNEQRITKMRCTAQGEDSDEVCVGTISLERSEKLESKFNFDQAIINLSLRQGRQGKDLCLGKFTNDPEKISANDRAERVLCNFIPTEGQSGITGEGHFNPGGYGTEENAHFHMTFTGFESGKEVRGCSVTGENRYRQAFTFQSYPAGTDDATVYGDLDEDEQSEFDDRKVDYSYDLYGTLAGEADLDLGANFTIDLSRINFGISSPAASSARTSGNRKRARARRRRRRKNANRRSLAVVAAQSNQSSVFKWLSFDPNGGGEIFIADNCKGDVAVKSYGRVVCGDADPTSDDDRSCITLTGSLEGVKAKGCKEPKNGYNLVSLRVKGLDDGEYTVCIGDTSVEEKLVVATDDSGSYGILEITDSETLSNEMPAVALFSENLTAATALGVSSTGDCSTLILNGSF